MAAKSGCAGEATDVTLEVFNHCAGSCTGCTLSVEERRTSRLSMTPERFSSALDALARHGAATGRRYRPVLVFADLPWLDLDRQRALYEAAAARALPLGVTMTLVEPLDAHYAAGLEAIIQADPGAVFDITIDPVRLARDRGYGARLRMAIARAPRLHLQALLSEAILARHAPEALAAALAAALGADNPVSLGFTPTLANLDRRNYGYDVRSAADYARRFYEATPAGRAHLQAERARFEARGDYGDFLDQTFHIGPDLGVYPVAYTLFGDVILDRRNGGRPLGHITDAPLADILRGPAARRLAMQNQAALDRGRFGCARCGWREACAFNGVGLARRSYKAHEIRTGACYGPRGLSETQLAATG